MISTVRFTVPSAFRNRRWTAPRSAPPASSPVAPTARSGTPSPSRSPTEAADAPNESYADSEGPLAVLPLISTVRFTVSLAFMNMTWTAPRSTPPASSLMAPTARSGTPSPSRSPMNATDAPNVSNVSSEGPLAVLPLIPMVRAT